MPDWLFWTLTGTGIALVVIGRLGQLAHRRKDHDA